MVRTKKSKSNYKTKSTKKVLAVSTEVEIELLRESEVRYRRLFESAKDGILILDAETGMINDVNPFLINLLGYSHEEFVGKAIWELGFFKDFVANKENFEELKSREYIRFEDMPLETYDGSRIEVEFVSSVYLVNNKKVIQCNIRDITAHNQTKEALENQLRQAQKMEAVGRLAGGIAHDFNNMLTVINSYAEFVIAGLRPGDPVRKDVEEILKAGERSAVLTHQLLAFSRRPALAPEILDINQIVAGIEPMLRRLIGEDIHLITHPAKGLGKIKADSGQIEQVIMNLAVNSRDAMRKGGKLAIGTANVELDEEYTAHHLEAEPGQYIMLAVTDNGCGMNAETIEHIFEPFYTTKELGKGTGLGLSTVYGIVKQSGGHIWVYSEPGKGTTFKVYLPREFSDATTANQAKKKIETSSGTETILVVEDEPGVLSLVKRVLEASGHTVHTASTGREALNVCERVGNSIQLLITDIVMPGMDGRELTEQLATICPGLKVLYMSGYTEDAIVRQGVFEHEINFISKPFSLPALKNKVREVLDR